MGILLALMAGYSYRTYWRPHFNAARQAIEAPPLPGRNSITGLVARQVQGSMWKADFDYFYTGEPRFAWLRLDLGAYQANSGASVSEVRSTFVPQIQRGAHHVSVMISYPGLEGSTGQVEIAMSSAQSKAIIARQKIDQRIDWPNFQGWLRDQDLVQRAPVDNLKHAVELIDTESSAAIAEAKMILERLIDNNPRYEDAYIELARVAMKSNWGPEGLHQAETYLDSALQIRPDSANAKILLGYVYTHQQRYGKAEAQFSAAAASNPRNLWLWANWGELLIAQGKIDQAMVKYREAVTRPMTHEAYDRARIDAYKHLLKLIEQRGNIDDLEALYKRRLAEFGPGSCYSTDYARFLLQVRGDTQGAIDLTRRALNQRCDDSPARQVLGMAEYVKWSSTTGEARIESINQARIFLPVGPMQLYLLATGDRTLVAAKKLLEAGEHIDQKDNDQMTALGYALQAADSRAAKRLLALGARPDTLVGALAVPVALIPIFEQNLDAIRAMQRAGVDYSKLTFRGASAETIAKQTGNNALVEALTHKGTAL